MEFVILLNKNVFIRSFINYFMGKLEYNYAKKGLGIFFIILGAIGAFLPFIPGVLLIIFGLILLGNETLKDFILKIIKFKK